MTCRIGYASFTLKDMRYRAFGKTGFQISEIGFGGWGIGGNAYGNSYGSTDDAESLKALNRAYGLGCNFFDTADVYGHGHSESLIGQALKNWNRDEIFIATAGGQDFSAEAQTKAGGVKPNFSAAYIRQALHASLQRLGLEIIDFYQLHTPPLEVIHHGQVFEVLQDLQKEGKIRFYGVVIHDPQEGVQAIQLGQVTGIQAIYNLFDTRIEKALLPQCEATETALIVREPLARGFLSGKMVEGQVFEPGDNRAVWPKLLIQKRVQAANRFKSLMPEGYTSLGQLALAFPLSQSAVSTVLVGCKTVTQVEENFAIVTKPLPEQTTLSAIREMQAGLY